MKENKISGVSGRKRLFQSAHRALLAGCLGIAALQMAGCATTSADKISKQATASKQSSQAPASRRTSVEEQWGIRIEGLRLSAGGSMLDFRYRIIDPEKATPLVRPSIKPHLIDQASGATLTVPTYAKLGPMRSVARYGTPKADRIYFVLFANPGGFVKAGNKVTVVIGEFKAENLVVQ